MNEKHKKSREELLVEVEEDLLKAEKVLLVDVYDEIINHDDNTRHAAKRFAALFGKNIIENAKLEQRVHTLNRRLYWLTIAVSVLTLISTAAGCIQAYYSYAANAQYERNQDDQDAKKKAMISPSSSR